MLYIEALSLPEIRALAAALTANDCSDEVVDLLDQLEVGEVSVWEVILILELADRDNGRWSLDTLAIGETRFRLHGIDVPEGEQTCQRNGVHWLCGQEAAAQLRELGAGEVVSCFETDRDQYGRVVAICTAGDTELGAAMVWSGLALAYREYGQEYVRHEAAAQEAGRGLWAGESVAPWDWRRGERATTIEARPVSDDCQIKGNINSRGDRIYHAPGMPSYENTVVTESRGERWFCSEEEAEQAGWRAPR